MNFKGSIGAIMKGLMVLFSVLYLSACASYPDKVAVTEGTSLVSFTEVNQPESNKIGELARFSGVIAEITNKKRMTVLDVLYYPAQSNGRPKLKGEPAGRFRVKVDQFLDPAVYKRGKSITALGKLKAKETAKIGEYEYEYPTIDNGKVYLWPKEVPQADVQFYYGWYGVHPRWYWQGGARHIYRIGDGKSKPPAAQAKNKQKTQ